MNHDEGGGRRNHGQGRVVVVANVVKKNVTFKAFEVSHEYQLTIYIMFMKTKELQLIIKGQYINNLNFVKPTLNLHTYEIQSLILIYMIFLNTSTKDDNVQIHGYTKYV